MLKKISLLSLILSLALPAGADVLKYTIDPVHSGVNFKVRHFLNKMPGSFTTFSGEIHYDPENPANNKAIATIAVSSVDTRNDDRDAHLQAEDYFNAAAHPTIEFSSTEWVSTGENTFLVKGVLEMMGQSLPVEMEVTYLGEMEARGKVRSGWEGKTTLDRSKWGQTSGQPAVGLEVEVELNIQAHR